MGSAGRWNIELRHRLRRGSSNCGLPSQDLETRMWGITDPCDLLTHSLILVPVGQGSSHFPRNWVQLEHLVPSGIHFKQRRVAVLLSCYRWNFGNSCTLFVVWKPHTSFITLKPQICYSRINHRVIHRIRS